jgi:hypothetical protein
MYTEGAEGVTVGAYDTQGVFFSLDSLKQKFNRDGAGNVTSVVASLDDWHWTQTFTYVNGKVDEVSGWVKSKVAG